MKEENAGIAQSATNARTVPITESLLAGTSMPCLRPPRAVATRDGCGSARDEDDLGSRRFVYLWWAVTYLCPYRATNHDGGVDGGWEGDFFLCACLGVFRVVSCVSVSAFFFFRICWGLEIVFDYALGWFCLVIIFCVWSIWYFSLSCFRPKMITKDHERRPSEVKKCVEPWIRPKSYHSRWLGNSPAVFIAFSDVTGW